MEPRGTYPYVKGKGGSAGGRSGRSGLRRCFTLCVNVHSALAQEAEGEDSGRRGGYRTSADDKVCNNLYAAAEGRRAVDQQCNDDEELGWGARRWLILGANKVGNNARHPHRGEERERLRGADGDVRWGSGDRCASQVQQQRNQDVQANTTHTRRNHLGQLVQHLCNCPNHRETCYSCPLGNPSCGGPCSRLCRCSDGDGVDWAVTKPLHQPTSSTSAPERGPERSAAGGSALRGGADEVAGRRRHGDAASAQRAAAPRGQRSARQTYHKIARSDGETGTGSEEATVGDDGDGWTVRDGCNDVVTSVGSHCGDDRPSLEPRDEHYFGGRGCGEHGEDGWRGNGALGSVHRNRLTAAQCGRRRVRGLHIPRARYQRQLQGVERAQGVRRALPREPRNARGHRRCLYEMW